MAASEANWFDKVVDQPAAYPPLLAPATADFCLVLFGWVLVAWLLRLVYLFATLREFEAVKAVGGLSVFEDVPMHHHVNLLDPDTRRRFLSFLRARVPPTPAAEVATYSSPIIIHGIHLRADSSSDGGGGSGGIRLEIESECMLPGTLQVFWGVDPHAELLELPRVDGRNSTPSSSSGRGGGHARAAGVRSSRRPQMPAVSSTLLSGETVSRSLSALRSTLATAFPAGARTSPQPMLHTHAIGAIELSTCSSMSGGSPMALVEEDGPVGGGPSSCHSRWGVNGASPAAGGGSGGGSGGGTDGRGPTSGGSGGGNPRSSERGRGHAWRGGQPSHAMPGDAFTTQSGTASVEAHAARQHLIVPCADLNMPLEDRVALAGAATRERLPPPPPRESETSSAVTAVVLFSNFAPCPPLCAESAGPVAARLAVSGAGGGGADDESTTASSAASAGTGDAGAGDAESAGNTLPQSLSTASRVPPLAVAFTVTFRPAGGAAADGSRASAAADGWNGTVVQQTMATPTGLLQLAEVFGLEDWEAEKCVACMEDPKDTILLPCRHLCVCAGCFELLTPLDRCPVCRAAFSSYLRFDTAAEAAQART